MASSSSSSSSPISRSGRALKVPLKLRPDFQTSSPSSPRVKTKRNPYGKRRGRPPKNYSANIQADKSALNKWLVYKKELTFLISSLKRNTYNLEVVTSTSSKDKIGTSAGNEFSMSDEKKKCTEGILKAKKRIRETFARLAAESAEDRQWDFDGKDDDMVDIEHVLCSKCMQPDEEGDDILLCDRAGCNRAYHQQCLDPAIVIDSDDPNDDWFCWHCECLDNCLDMVNEFREVEGEEEFDHELRVYEDVATIGSDETRKEFLEEDSDDETYDPDEDEEEDDDDVDEDENSYCSDGGENSTVESASYTCGSNQSVDDDELDLLLQDSELNMSADALINAPRVLRSSTGIGRKKTADTVSGDSSDVGKTLAAVFRGEVNVGMITNYNEEGKLWTVIFDNGAELLFDEERVARGFGIFLEYQLTREELDQAGDSEEDNTCEVVDARNIVEGGRRRSQIDYAQLAIQMFGSVKEDEDTDSEREYVPRQRITRESESSSPKKRGRPPRKAGVINSTGDNAARKRGRPKILSNSDEGGTSPPDVAPQSPEGMSHR